MKLAQRRRIGIIMAASGLLMLAGLTINNFKTDAEALKLRDLGYEHYGSINTLNYKAILAHPLFYLGAVMAAGGAVTLRRTSRRGEEKMGFDNKRRLVRWQKGCLLITVIQTLPALFSYLKRPIFNIPKEGIIEQYIGIWLIAIWIPLALYWLDLKILSSISALLIGLSYVGAVMAAIFLNDANKLVLAPTLLLGVFYIFYGARTWRLHNVILNNERKEDGNGRPNS